MPRDEYEVLACTRLMVVEPAGRAEASAGKYSTATSAPPRLMAELTRVALHEADPARLAGANANSTGKASMQKEDRAVIGMSFTWLRGGGWMGRAASCGMLRSYFASNVSTAHAPGQL